MAHKHAYLVVFSFGVVVDNVPADKVGVIAHAKKRILKNPGAFVSDMVPLTIEEISLSKGIDGEMTISPKS